MFSSLSLLDLGKNIINYFAGFAYNSTGLLACEPFYNKASYRILATCAFYFPTTMVLMYCYGSSFHANRFRLATAALPSTSSSTTFTMPNNHAIMAEKVMKPKVKVSSIVQRLTILREKVLLPSLNIIIFKKWINFAIKLKHVGAISSTYIVNDRIR